MSEIERTSTRIESLRASLANIIAASEISPPDDEHDPEGATVGFERAQTAALLEAAEAQLEELAAARRRLQVGTYGRCHGCGRPIADERLRARPAALTCVSCATRGVVGPGTTR